MIYSETKHPKTAAAPDISIIMPTYNVEKYFSKAITSLRLQTLQNIEILLIDDGSTDKTYEMCLLHQKQDKRIKVIRSVRNCGVSAARNLGVAAAKGHYIAFVDSDDWVEPDMMEYLLKLLESKNADIATCEICKEYPNGKKKVTGSHKSYLATQISIIDAIHYGGDFTPYLVDKLYRRELLDGLRFQENITVGEDYRFLMEIMLKNPLVVHGGECKYHYQQLKGSVTHRGFESEKNTIRNRLGHKDTFDMVCNYDPRLRNGALAYYILQEMAVVISMVKSNRYDKPIIKSVQRRVRKYIKDYVRIKQVPSYLKICAALLCLHEILLLLPYRLLFHFQNEY